MNRCTRIKEEKKREEEQEEEAKSLRAKQGNRCLILSDSPVSFDRQLRFSLSFFTFSRGSTCNGIHVSRRREIGRRQLSNYRGNESL